MSILENSFSKGFVFRDSTEHKGNALMASFMKLTLRVCRYRNLAVDLYTTYLRKILQYSSCVWNTEYIQDLIQFDYIQRRWSKQIDSLDSGGCREQ